MYLLVRQRRGSTTHVGRAGLALRGWVYVLVEALQGGKAPTYTLRWDVLMRLLPPGAVFRNA